MAPNIQKTAAVSHVLLMLVLWSSSNTLRAVDGSFLEACSCSGVYTPPNVLDNCSNYLVTPCPCPGEPQSSEETKFQLLIIPSKNDFFVRWSQLPMEGVSYSLRTASTNAAVSLTDMARMQTSGTDHTLAGQTEQGIAPDTMYTLTFCGLSNTTKCGCSTIDISTVNGYTPSAFQVLDVTSTGFRVSWVAPNDGIPAQYNLIYRAMESQTTANMTFPGTTLPNPTIGNLLPQTTYSVQVEAVFNPPQSSTTNEFIITTLPDGPLALQLYQNQLSSFERSEDIAACGLAFADVMRNTRFFSDFFGVQNVNGSLTSFTYNLQLRQILYTTTNSSIFSMSYSVRDSLPLVEVEGEQRILDRSQALHSLQYDWTSGRLYWIEDETMIATSQASGSDIQTVLVAGSVVEDIQLDPAHGYLYWLSGGQVRRCPLNLAVECLAKAEQIPTSLSSVNDFAIDSASNDTVLYRVTGNQLSVSGPAGDSETIFTLNVSNAQTVLVAGVNIIILEDGTPLEVRNKNLDLLCAKNTNGSGESYVSVLDSQAQMPFRPPNPPTGTTFIITGTSVNVTWLSPSRGAPTFSEFAPWRYTVEYSIGTGVQQTTVTEDTFFSLSNLNPGDPVTIRVIAEGQPDFSSTAPRFTVVTQNEADQMLMPLLLGTVSGLYQFEFEGQSNEVANPPSQVDSLAQDILRNVTYVLHNGNRIGVVNGSTYSFLFQRSTAKSLTVDWVANVLYWIEGGSMIMKRSTVSQDMQSVDVSGSFTHLTIDPVLGLLFTTNGSYVTFHKVNGQPVQGSTQCSSRLDPVLAMEADPSSKRLFWVSLRFGRLVLNWANYTREMCSNSGETVIPELELGLSVPRCALSVSNGVLAMKVENVNEIWTVPVAVFSFLQVDSSPGLRLSSLPAGMGSGNEIYDIAFQQSDAIGLVPGLSPASLAIPGAPTPNATDRSAALDVITIHWSAMEFTLSPVMYNVMYTLTRTNGSVDSDSEMTTMTSIVLENQTPYTNVKVTINAMSYWGSSGSRTFSFRSTSAAPTDALRDVTASVYQPRRGSDAVAVLVQWGQLTSEQLRGRLVEYRVEVSEQGQSVRNVTVPPNKLFGLLDSSQLTSNVLYEIQVYAVTEFPTVSGVQTGFSPPSERVQFNSSNISPPLEVLVSTADGSVLVGNQQTPLNLSGPLEYDALLRTYYGFTERNGMKVLSSLSVGVDEEVQELTVIPSGAQVMSLVLDWISKKLYMLSRQGAQLVIHSWDTQGGQSLQTVYSANLSFTAVTGRISPFAGKLYYARTASGSTALFSLDVRPEGNKTLLSIYPPPATGRRRRQTCSNPLSMTVNLAPGFATDGTGRAWLSDAGTGDIWSCTITATELCDCVMEVTAAITFPTGLLVRAETLAVDEARVYWTIPNMSGVYYIQLNSNRTMVNNLTTMASTNILATSPGLQQLPDDFCLYPRLEQQPTPTYQDLTNSTARLSWPPAVLPSNCTEVIASLAPPDYFVRYGQVTVKSNFATTIELTDLVPYTEYTVRVSARNLYTPTAMADTLFGGLLTFRTRVGVPEAPRSLSVVTYGTRALRVSWDPPLAVFDDESNVRYIITASGNDVQTRTVQTSSHVARVQDVTGLEPGTLYTVQVSAMNSVHMGMPVVDTGTTWALPPTLVAMNITNTTVRLQADFLSDPMPPIQQVVLQQNINDMWQNISDLRSVQNEPLYFNISDLLPARMYSYRLYGVYEPLLGGTPHSAAGEATTFISANGVPSRPVGLHQDNNFLRWDTLVANGEEIEQLTITFARTDGELPVMVNLSSPGEQTSLDLSVRTDIVVGVRYNVTMVAQNALGPSEQSDSVSVTKLASFPTEAAIAIGVVGAVLLIVFLVLCCLFMWCCSIHYQNLKRREAIQQIAANPNYDADLERLRVLKFSRDDYRSRVDYIYNGNDLERLEKFSRDKITLDKLLGEGAFGEVISGTVLFPEDPDPKPVAIKVLHKDATEEQKRTFLSEAIIMSHFNHENVLKVVGVCINNNPNFIILELMDAGNLLQFLREAKRNQGSNLLTPTELTKISLDVAKGAKYLEALKFIHRDLAARNCLVSSYGEDRVVKIADFGLARDLYSHEYYRKEGQGLLPIRWMPPESLQEGLFTTKSDVWAYGVTLWEIWTMGHQPYPARTNHEVFEFVIHGGRNEKVEGTPNAMYNLMTQCWQQNPEDRPTFFSIADKLKLHHERLKCASVCIDDDLSDLEEEGELKRGDSNRSWLRGSLRDSMRRIRTSIHRTGSLRAIRRQSSFKGDSSSHPTNGQVSSGSADNLLESAFKESGPI